jgi:tight adherence protein B
MTAAELLYGVGGATLVVSAAIPALRARRRWRRLLQGSPRQTSKLAPQRDARGYPIWRSLPMDRWWSVATISAGFGALGLTLGGPVAGTVAASYGAAAVVMLNRRSRTKNESQSRVVAVDAVAALAAELRAGAAVGPALATIRASVEGPRVVGAGAHAVAGRLTAAIELAETSGAPLADVLDRLDSHLRAAERARSTAEAQAAGALASAALLAVMPVAGAGLGVLVGINPAQVLLHTPIGAACLCAAVLLQLAGLAWSARLSRIEVAA